MTRIRRAARAAAAVPLILLALAGSLDAQTARVAVERENFRAEPGGAILAEVYQGTVLTVGEARGQWREATLEAWIYGRSVRDQRAGELDVVVNASGENLRATPNGERLGRAKGGMRLDRLETRDRWLRVQRTGWIWAPSIEGVEPETPAAEPTPPAAAPAPAPAPAPAGRPTREFRSAAAGGAILDAPGGDTVAALRPGADVEVVRREGDWTRVRIEGWTYTGALAAGGSAAAPVLVDVARDSIQADPERFRGRIVEWAVQFIALQEAERFRTEFVEGEPFILARGPGDDPGFVYIAIPPDQREAARRLSPLQQVRVLARIRTPRSSLTGAPVLELLEIIGR